MKIKVLPCLTHRYCEENYLKDGGGPFIGKCCILEVTHGENSH